MSAVRDAIGLLRLGAVAGLAAKEEATKLYNGLVADGGKPHPQMPLGDSFWGSWFGMLTDKFGIQWMVNYQYPKK